MNLVFIPCPGLCDREELFKPSTSRSSRGQIIARHRILFLCVAGSQLVSDFGHSLPFYVYTPTENLLSSSRK